MTTDEIIEMAKEAGFGNYAYEAASTFGRFAALVAAAEREACAQVCDYYATALDYGSSPYTHSRECKQAAAAIRAKDKP